jgi:hypothetical protein
MPAGNARWKCPLEMIVKKQEKNDFTQKQADAREARR